MFPPNRGGPPQNRQHQDEQHQRGQNSQQQYSPTQNGNHPRPPHHLPPPGQILPPHHPHEGPRPDMNHMQAMPQYRQPHPHDPYAGGWNHPPSHAQYGAPQGPAPRQRTAIACRYCRRRKIRCSGFEASDDGKCTNCVRFGQDCVFTPVASQTQAFVPAHTVWRGNGQPPPQMYGAYGQPLQPPTPPQQQPDPYGPGASGRPPHHHRPPTPPHGQDPYARAQHGYPSAGPYSAPSPYYSDGASCGTGKGSSAGGGSPSVNGENAEVIGMQRSGSHGATNDQSGKKRSMDEKHIATLPPPLRPSWQSTKSHASESQMSFSQTPGHAASASLRPVHLQPAHHDKIFAERPLTPMDASPAYPPPPTPQHYQQQYGASPHSPYYTSAPQSHHPHHPPPRHGSPQSAYHHDAHRTSTSPLAAAPTTPAGASSSSPYGSYGTSESGAAGTSAATGPRSHLAPVANHDAPARSPTSAGPSQPSAGRSGMSIRDIVSSDQGGRSAADSQMLNQLNRRPM